MEDLAKTTVVRTACPAHCGGDACGILAHVRDGQVVKVEPADFPDPKIKRICLRGLASLELTYHEDRLKHPLKRVGKRGGNEFERISWDEALDTIATRFKGIADRYSWQALGWVLGGPGSGTTKFGAYLRLANLTQSTRVSTFGYGDAALPCGSRALFGTLTAEQLLSCWSDPELVVVWGANPGEASPVDSMRYLMDVKDKGAQVVVIDPRFTITASKADEYIGINPGTDTALALGIMNLIFRDNVQDEDFIRRHTNGPFLVRNDNGAFLRGKDLGLNNSKDYVIWDTPSNTARLSTAPGIHASLTGRYTVNGIDCIPAFHLLKDLVVRYTPHEVARITGVPEEIIGKLSHKFTSARPFSIITRMGFTRTFHGDMAIRAVGTLASVTGNIRLTSAAGHRPVKLNWRPFLHTDPAKPPTPRIGVLQFYDAVISGNPFPIKAAWFAFINFLNQCANSNKIAKEVFPNLEFIVVTDLFMTDSARYADIILPACSYLEFSDLVTGLHPYLQLQQKVIQPLYESRSDVTIVSELAKRLGFGSYFDMDEEGFIDLLLNSGEDSVGKITVKRLREGPILTTLPQVVTPETDIQFSTPSGKIDIYVEKLHEFGQALPEYQTPLESPVETREPKDCLSYIQGHSRFRTHSMFANSPTLLELNPEPVVEIHASDAERLKISDGDTVTISNDRGRVTLKTSINEGVKPGVINIMQGWWSDQFEEGGFNCLTHDTINPAQEAIFEPNMAMNDVAVKISKAYRNQED